MVKKQRKARVIRVKKVSRRGLIFYFNIVLAISIIGLTVYDVGVGESILDHKSRSGVLSAKSTPTPTPTFAPEMP